MKHFATLVFATTMLPIAAQAGEAGDALREHLYAGTAADGLAAAVEGCASDDYEACFAEGMFKLVLAYEGLSAELYRYGATAPGNTPIAMMFGFGVMGSEPPANPEPEQLSYEALRTVLDDFVTDLDAACASFERAATDGDYVITIDPQQVSLDFNGDGVVDQKETLGALLAAAQNLGEMQFPDEPPIGGKTKTPPPTKPDTTIGFDRADAYWLAGYLQVTAAPIDLILAHDFTGFFDVYLHRVFPKSGLPMEAYATSPGSALIDPESDTGIADLIAGLHMLRFPVTEPERLAGVLERLKAITSLSRQNWELILAETDDNRELVPSPSQTSILPDMEVTEETVAAWRDTLDTVDLVLAGELLVPHWRFERGFDLKAYFETAEETDLVLLIAGSGAVPYLRDGPIADAQSFAAANRAFGSDWLNYAFWFN